MSKQEMIDCPNHEGGYDCTPFCRICEGEQGYYPTNKLPERINVMKVISYDVQDIVERLTENDETLRTVTLEEVMQQVEAWVEEDFPADRIKDLIIQNQDGEEL
jgi:hypothetical protein